MSVITFPDSLVDKVSRLPWGQQRNDMEFRSIFGAQALEGSGPLWTAAIEFGDMLESESGAVQALIMQLRGRTNQLALWNLARPAPLGTMRGTMTLSADAAQGATSLSITAGVGQAGKTLLAGDFIGIGSGLTQQVVMVTADATANGSGVISVSIEPPLRNAFASGASVTWDKPKALFRRQSSKSSWDYASVLASGFSLDLLEDSRP